MTSLLRRIALLALATGILFDILVPGNAAGLNAPIVMAALLAAAALVAGRDGIPRMDPADAWLAPTALVLASLAAIRADGWLVAVDLLLAAALAAGAIGCMAGGRVTRGLVPRVLELAVGVVAVAGIGTLNLLTSRRPAPVEPEVPGRTAALRARLRGATPVLRGLLIAVPVLAVFVALFASADAVFARITSDVLAWQPDIDIEEVVTRAVVITIVAWTAAGLLGLAGGLLPAYLPSTTEDPGPERAPDAEPASPVPGRLPPAPPAPRTGGSSGGPAAATWPASHAWVAATRPAEVHAPLRLGTTEGATILVVVDVLFAVFVMLQLAYLFGGTDPMAMAGLTYAEYARRGFFELVLVALLAGGLVVTLDSAVGSRSRGQLAGALVLLALTAVVLVSALLRLRLYQSMYGWTELRLVVLIAIAWLGVALAVAAALLLLRRTRWSLHVLGIMVLVAVGALNVIGPQAFVTGRNLERAIDPSLVPPGGRTGLDTDYLAQFGDGAVAPIVDAWERLAQTDRDALAPALEWRADELRTDPLLQGWPAWNLTRERARAALRGWEAAPGPTSVP